MGGISRRSVLIASAAAPALAGVAQAKAQAQASPPAFQTLKYEAQGPICVITLNRPDSDNMIDDQNRRELAVAWEAFRADEALQVAIFTGAGDTVFCGGADLASFRGGPQPKYVKRDEGIRTYTAKQNRCWKPVIAAINGFVSGPGLHFLVDADICISVPEATFSDMHMHRTGAVPIIEPIEMARKIPQEAVARMFLLGPHEPITAQRALDLGLISEIVPRARLMARATELARQICQADLRLTMAFIESFYKARELGVSEAINRGLIIRQATGYQDAPYKGRPVRDLAKLGSKL
ncbi:enoyl-CoA hydratase/isomerase family protein [Sphingomonas soli]|uniref:enoyl-CoA hydratase/isomerase family protein n=1 Tax=Sphingomonas soli TaxID=266127 RepID=UPI000832F94A|nr:enoyl-CoA hydratase/isomerase family protein [Sphingomonas soli]